MTDGTSAVGPVAEDVLGAPYEARTITLTPDDEGPIVATLVRRAAAVPTNRALLYLHGFSDYFFQTELAEFAVRQGCDFYALDLRKSGRSRLEGQTPHFVRDLGEYDDELDEAMRLIREVDGHEHVVVVGHSTGGLVAPLWLARRADCGWVQALVLNSPFLELPAPLLMRTLGADALGLLARRRPYQAVPLGDLEKYGRSIQVEYDGEWEFDTRWKPIAGIPERAGWLAAIRRGQRTVRAGLGLTIPVLVLCSARGVAPNAAPDEFHHGDGVLDPDLVAERAPHLGRLVTIVRIDDGRHDLLLSAPAVRGGVYDEVERWLRTYAPV